MNCVSGNTKLLWRVKERWYKSEALTTCSLGWYLCMELRMVWGGGGRGGEGEKGEKKREGGRRREGEGGKEKEGRKRREGAEEGFVPPTPVDYHSLIIS